MQHSVTPLQGGLIQYDVYHGSDVSGLTSLSSAYSRTFEFSPATYCSAEPGVAIANTRDKRSASLYRVRCVGRRDGVLNPTAYFSQLDDKVRYRLDRVTRNFGLSVERGARVDDHLTDIKLTVGPEALGRALIAAGVWAIVGEMHAMSVSGYVDRGDQYRILNDKHIVSVQQIPLP